MRFLPFSCLGLAWALLACDQAKPTTAEAGGTSSPAMQQAPAAAHDDPTGPPAVGAAAPAKGPYRLLGITDPDLGNMVAFALKVPTGWPVRQSFRREWEGAVPHNKISIAFRSPDGTQQVEYLPLSEYVYADGPMTQQLRLQKQQMGMTDTRMTANELPPMPAAQYLRQYLLPQLAQQGLALRNVGNPRETAPHRTAGSNRPESSASVDGVLPNGHPARVEVRMWLSQQQNQGETYYSWAVVPSITQTSGNDLAATYAHTQVAQESIVPNPAWQAKTAELAQRGYAANSDASRRQHEANMQQQEQFGQQMTAGHNQRMNDIARQGAANTARHNERMAGMDQQMASSQATEASRDRQHEAYVDNVVRNETKYADPGTGERTKLDNRYDHAYTDGQGTYYQSNTPIEPGNVNWQQLQQVSQSDY